MVFLVQLISHTSIRDSVNPKAEEIPVLWTAPRQIQFKPTTIPLFCLSASTRSAKIQSTSKEQPSWKGRAFTDWRWEIFNPKNHSLWTCFENRSMHSNLRYENRHTENYLGCHKMKSQALWTGWFEEISSAFDQQAVSVHHLSEALWTAREMKSWRQAEGLPNPNTSS